MTIKYAFFFLILLVHRMPLQAQWDWETGNADSDAERKTTESLSFDLFNEEEFRTKVLQEIGGGEHPKYEQEYASYLAGLVQKLKGDGKIISDWSYWEDQIYQIIEEITHSDGVRSEYAVLIIDDATHNIFATEGGLVIVTAAMLADIESMDELRFILAHEMAHVKHHHPYFSYVKKQIDQVVENIAVVAMAASVGVVWIHYNIGESPFLKRPKHKQEFETIADDFAVQYMKKQNHSVSLGARLYHLFARDVDKYNFQTGSDPPSILYCASHPQPAERFKTIVQYEQQDEVANESKEFYSWRHLARMRKFDYLLLLGASREVIDVGWHYLLKETSAFYEKEIKEKMLQALDQQRIKYTANYVFGRVLSDGYKIDEEIEVQLANADVSSDEAKKLVKAVLKMTDRRVSNPFPVNITFSQLNDTIRQDLELTEKLEEDFRLKVYHNELEEEFLNYYISEGGLYQYYAQYLLNPGKQHLYRTVLMPIILEVHRYSGDKNYGELYRLADWEILLKTARKDFDKIEVLSVEDETLLDSKTRDELRSLNSMFRFGIGNNEMDFSSNQLHPSIMNFACEYDIGEFYLITYFENSNIAFSQVIELDVYKDKTKQALYRKLPISGDSKKNIPRRIMSTYSGLMKQTPHPFVVH